ncbi:hypothetical protein FRC02_010852 [Tulasnella sp. 418]|nr:hypothetical protein FRC02_010852 [Tulasnella sp. 418]
MASNALPRPRKFKGAGVHTPTVISDSTSSSGDTWDTDSTSFETASEASTVRQSTISRQAIYSENRGAKVGQIEYPSRLIIPEAPHEEDNVPDDWSETNWTDTTTELDGNNSDNASVGSAGTATVSSRPSRTGSTRTASTSSSVDASKVWFYSESGRHQWHELPSTFTDESQIFAKLLAFDPSVPEHRREGDPCNQLENLSRVWSGAIPLLEFRLHGISDFDFESLMWGLRPKLGRKIPLNRLKPMLVLATKWEMHNIREFALRHIPKFTMAPLEKIVLCREARVPEWLLKPHVALCIRIKPMNMEEAEILGVKTLAAITSAREKIVQRRWSMLIGSMPKYLFNKATWWHSTCWDTLTYAWRKVLTEEKYGEIESVEKSMLQALEDIKIVGDGNPWARYLCWHCDNEMKKKDLGGWLKLEEDELLATETLTKMLGTGDWI